jgi:hypothetical protein
VDANRLASGVAFALLLVASLSPVFVTPIPAMVDYPNHLARMYILASSGSPNANPYYQVAWALYPNLAMDLIVPQLAQLIGGVEQATRLFLLLSQVLVISGALAIEWVVKGRFQISGIVALMFLYCLPFAWGFLNFEFGLGMALWGIAIYLRVQNRSWAIRLGVNTIFVAALFVAHFFALGIYGATLGLYELWRAWDVKATYRNATLRFAVLVIPALAMLSIMAFTGGSIGSADTRWRFALKFVWPGGILNGYSLTVSAASVTMLVIGAYVATKRGMLSLKPAGLWLSAGFVILYLVIPSRLFDTSFADIRIIPAAALILPAFCELSLPSHRWKLVMGAGAGAIILGNLAVVLFVWTSYRAEYAAMIESFRKLDKGAMVLIAGDGSDPPLQDLTDYPIFQAPTLAVQYANAFVPQLYTSKGKQPVRAHPPEQRLDLSGGGPVPIALLQAISAGNTAAGTPAFIQSWYRDFDYLYVVGSRVEDPVPAMLVELQRSSRFVLYKIRHLP